MKIGKICAFNNDSGVGTIILEDTAEKVEFSVQEWIDTELLPKFGLEVQLLEDGIKTLTQSAFEAIKEDVSFEACRELILAEFKKLNHIRVAQDIEDSFYIRLPSYSKEEMENLNYYKDNEALPENTGGFLHLKFSSKDGLTLKMSNNVFNKEFSRKLLSLNLTIVENEKPFSLDGETETKTPIEDKNAVSEETYIAEEKEKSFFTKYSRALIIGAVVILAYLFWEFIISRPGDKIVKNIAAQLLNANPSKISILSSTKKEGRVIYSIQAGVYICKMPMIKNAESDWVGLGINCTN